MQRFQAHIGERKRLTAFDTVGQFLANIFYALIQDYIGRDTAIYLQNIFRSASHTNEHIFFAAVRMITIGWSESVLHFNNE